MKVDLNASIGWTEARDLAADFLRWWRGELQSLVPQYWQQRAASAFSRRTISLDGETWRISKDGCEILALDMSEPDDVLHRRIQTVDAACLSSRLHAELPASSGLVRGLRLPAAAEHKLRAVIGLSLGRLSPFRTDSVSYDAKIVGRIDDQIEVEVGIVPKETLKRYEARLQSIGLHVREFRMPGGRLCLLPVSRRRTANERLQLLLGAIAIAAWGLAIFAIPLSRQAEISSLSAELTSLRGPAEHARALSSELARLQRPLSMASSRLAQPDALDTLRTLSSILPSDIQLSSLEIGDGKVRLSGTGAEPAQIREELRRTAYFRDVTVTQAGGEESFRAEMTLAEHS